MQKQFFALVAFVAIIGAVAGGGAYVKNKLMMSGNLTAPQTTTLTATSSLPDDGTMIEAEDAEYAPDEIMVTIQYDDGTVMELTQMELEEMLLADDVDVDAGTDTGGGAPSAPPPAPTPKPPLVCKNIEKTGKVRATGYTTPVNVGKPKKKFYYRCVKSQAENSAEAEARKGANKACLAIRNSLERCAAGCDEEPPTHEFTQTSIDTDSTEVKPSDPLMNCALGIGYKSTSKIEGTCTAIRECKVPPPPKQGMGTN